MVSPKGAYLGTGFVSLHSKIRVRLISRNANDTFDAAFWRRRVEYAWAYRKTVLEPADLTACRVIFGEADQFPGLTVDRFHDILVTQTLSVGMEKLKPVLFPLLAEVLRADGQTIAGIYERNDEALRAKEGLEQNKGWFDLPGETHPASTLKSLFPNIVIKLSICMLVFPFFNEYISIGKCRLLLICSANKSSLFPCAIMIPLQ